MPPSICPLTVVNEYPARFVNNTANPIALTHFNGYLDKVNTGAEGSWPYYLVNSNGSTFYDAIVYDMIPNGWNAASVMPFPAGTVYLNPGDSVYIADAYGPQDGTFKVALYLPAQNVWCGINATNPNGFWGVNWESVYTLHAWSGFAWAPGF